MVEIVKLDGEKSALDKRRSRERDDLWLAAGEVTRQDLSRENGFFAALDLKQFRITAIGGEPFGKPRRRMT